jgi:DUF438 domain-containing protein
MPGMPVSGFYRPAAPRQGNRRMKEEKDKKMEELIGLAMECLGVGVTIIDTEGILLYYNQQAAEILDRRPEYIGKDIYSHHRKATSSQKVQSMIQDFQKGRREPFHYKAKPYGKTIVVALSPILEKDRFLGCAQCVQLEENIESRGNKGSGPHI